MTITPISATTADRNHDSHLVGQLLALPMSQDAIEAMPFPLTIYTSDGLYVGANALVEQLFRVPRAAVLGTFNILTSPSSQDQTHRQLFLAAAAGERGQSLPQRYDFSFPGTTAPDRSGCWIEASYFPFRDVNGQITHVGLLLQDVTERVEGEQRLRLFQTMCETALDAVAFSSLDGVLEYANPVFRTMSGFGDALVGASLSDLFAPEDRPYVVQTMLPDLYQNGAWTGTLPAQRPDGTTWMAHINIVTLTDADGNPDKIAGVCRDITLQKAQEQRLRQVEMMVENAPDGYSFTELDGRILYLNPAFRTLLRYPDIPVGAPLLQFFADHEHGRIGQLVQQVITHGNWQGPITYRRSDGSLFDAQLAAFLIRDEHGRPTGLAGIARDLTEEQQRERERHALQEQVIAAQQAALRELSTPLIPIAEGVVAMPLIGSIDSSRAQLIIETLLNGVAALRATTTIIDITGVAVVDTQVANALLRAAQAVKLLGARVILTGIRPEVAQTLVSLGVDLSGIITRSTLQAGVAEVLSRRV